MSFCFNLLTLNIQLRGGPFRKVTIPDYYTFAHLHELMVFLFEWDNSHLHRFEVPKISDLAATDMDLLWIDQLENYRDNNEFTWISNPMSFLRAGDQKEVDEQEVDLQDAFKKIGDIIAYEYDFGDSWRAQIILENIQYKTIKKQDFNPCIKIVDGAGKTIPEYGQYGGTPYNKNKLNQDIAEISQFIYFPVNTKKYKQQNDDDGDDDINNNDDDDNETKTELIIPTQQMMRGQINAATEDEYDVDKNLNSLSNDLVINIIQYLRFADIIRSVLKLNKRFYRLQNNPHLLYSLKNFPITRRRSFALMERYCSHLIKIKKTNSFIYRDIKKLEWVNLMFGVDSTENYQSVTPTSLLFKNLYSLKFLNVRGISTILIRHLPIQKQLESLIIHSVKHSIDFQQAKLLRNFFKNKICINSLCTLKELSIDHVIIDTEFLEIFSKMVQLESFGFNEILFNRKQYQNGSINKELVHKTFSCWRNIRKLDIFDISEEAGYCTFYNDEMYDLLLQIFLSFESLQSLKLQISPFADEEDEEYASSINRVLPYFEQFKCLEELYLFVTVANFSFIENIIKIIQKPSCNNLKAMGLNFGAMDDDYSKLDIDSLVIQCMKMTTDRFDIELAEAKKDYSYYYGSRNVRDRRQRVDELMFFMNFSKSVFKFRKEINIRELKVKFVYFADLIEVIPRVSKYAKLLSIACDKIGCNLKMKWIHGDEIYEKEEWNDIYHHLSGSGFLVNHSHPDLTCDCCLLYHQINQDFWILLLFVFILSWKSES